MLLVPAFMLLEEQQIEAETAEMATSSPGDVQPLTWDRVPPGEKGRVQNMNTQTHTNQINQ